MWNPRNRPSNYSVMAPEAAPTAMELPMTVHDAARGAPTLVLVQEGEVVEDQPS